MTLGPEGGAHQSVITPSIGIEQPGCVAYEPAFGQDLEWCLLHALSRLGRPGGESAYFRLSTRPVDQALHTGTRAEAIAGRLPAPRQATARSVAIAVMGALVPEAIAAADVLEAEAGVATDVVCITSADLLFRSHQARAGLGDGDPATLERLFPPHVPIVALLDGHPHTLAFLGAAGELPRRAALRPVGRPRRSSTSTTRSTRSRSSARRSTCSADRQVRPGGASSASVRPATAGRALRERARRPAGRTSGACTRRPGPSPGSRSRG